MKGLKLLALLYILFLIVSCQKSVEVKEILPVDKTVNETQEINKSIVEEKPQANESAEALANETAETQTEETQNESEEELPPPKTELYLVHDKEVYLSKRYAFINVSIRNAEDIRAYQFQLNYDPSILSVASYSETDFMKQKEGMQTLRIVKQTNNSYLVAVSATEGGAYGNGVLGFFTVTFNSKGNSSLILNNTDLVNSKIENVRHIARNSSITVK